jgi:hypothetical protein
MKYVLMSIVVSVGLSGCALVPAGMKKPVADVDLAVDEVIVDGVTQKRPQARPADAANAPLIAPKPAAVSGASGRTIASLGSPAEPGLWLKTPLVNAAQSGKVSYKGKTIDVQLIPIEGPKTAGSRLSLQGFQSLGAPLTELIDVSVSL